MNLAHSLLFLAISVILAPAIFSQTSPAGVPGKYITGHEFGGGLIKLNADGTFEQLKGSDDGMEITTSGNFNTSGDRISFSISKSVGGRRGERQFNLLDPKELSEYSRGEAAVAPKEFSMFLMNWSGRIYLISERDMKNFADAINMGIEPRNAPESFDEQGSPWMGSFYLRSGDEKKKVSGAPPVPRPWADLLLERPITAKVLRIDNVEKRSEWFTLYTATIDKGSRAGIKIGIKLLNPDYGPPTPWDGPEVVSVEPGTAQIKFGMGKGVPKVGDVLSTKYQPVGLFR